MDTESKLEQVYQDFVSVISETGKTVKNFVKSFKNLTFSFTVAMSNNPEIKKCMMIYRRTKKKRIKKKQMSKIKKLL